MSDYVGTKEALALKAKQLIIVNVGYNGQNRERNWNMMNLTSHALELLSYQAFKKDLAIAKAKKVHIVEIILETKEKIHITDYHKSKELIALGEGTAKKALRKIKM